MTVLLLAICYLELYYIRATTSILNSCSGKPCRLEESEFKLTRKIPKSIFGPETHVNDTKIPKQLELKMRRGSIRCFLMHIYWKLLM